MAPPAAPPGNFLLLAGVVAEVSFQSTTSTAEKQQSSNESTNFQVVIVSHTALVTDL